MLNTKARRKTTHNTALAFFSTNTSNTCCVSVCVLNDLQHKWPVSSHGT